MNSMRSTRCSRDRDRRRCSQSRSTDRRRRTRSCSRIRDRRRHSQSCSRDRDRRRRSQSRSRDRDRRRRSQSRSRDRDRRRRCQSRSRDRDRRRHSQSRSRDRDRRRRSQSRSRDRDRRRHRQSRSRERDRRRHSQSSSRDRDRRRRSQSRNRDRRRHSQSRSRERDRRRRSQSRSRDRDLSTHTRSRSRDRDGRRCSQSRSRDRDRRRHSQSRSRDRDGRRRSQSRSRDRDRSRHNQSRSSDRDRRRRSQGRSRDRDGDSGKRKRSQSPVRRRRNYGAKKTQPSRPDMKDNNKQRHGDFIKLLFRIAGDLGRGEVKKLKFLCKSLMSKKGEVEEIQKREIEHIDHAMDLFQILMERNLISADDPQVLTELLQQLGRRDLAVVIHPFRLSIITENISWLLAHLQEKYRRHFEDFKPIPWNTNVSLSLTEIYTRLRVMKSNGGWGFRKGLVIKNEIEIFQKTGTGLPCRRIAIDGAPAMGKSTFCRKLAYDWACRKLPQFQLLFFLEMRHVSDNESIDDIIFNQLLPKDAKMTKTVLHDYLQQNQNSVLCVFDGLDEMTSISRKKSDIPAIISEKLLTWCTVVTTTRPVMLHSSVDKCHAKFRIEGFTIKDAINFIEKYFTLVGKKKDAEKLISELKFENVKPPHDRYVSYGDYYDHDDYDYSDSEYDDDDTTGNHTRFDVDLDDYDYSNSDDDTTGSHTSDDDTTGSHTSDDDTTGCHTSDDDTTDSHTSDDDTTGSHTNDDYTTGNHTRYDLLCNPLHITFVCLLWEEKKHIPTGNMTDIYTEILDCVLKRYCCKNGKELVNDKVPQDVKDDVDELAHCAYNACLDNYMILKEAGLSETVLNLGLLVKDSGISRVKPQRRCFFYHKTWLEYFTALHICKNVQDFGLSSEEELDSYKKQVYIFIAGILKNDADPFLKQLIRKMQSKYNGESLYITAEFRFICECLREANIAIDYLAPEMPYHVILKDYNHDHDGDFGYHHPALICNSAILDDKNKYGLLACSVLDLHQMSSMLCQNKSSVTNIKHLNILNGSPEKLSEITRQVTTVCPSLTTFEINFVSIECMQLLASALRRGWKLNTLILSLDNDLELNEKTSHTVTDLFQSVSCNEYLKTFFWQTYFYSMSGDLIILCRLDELIEDGPETLNLTLIPDYSVSIHKQIDSPMTLWKFIQKCKKTSRLAISFSDYFDDATFFTMLSSALKSSSPVLTSVGIFETPFFKTYDRTQNFVEALNVNSNISDFASSLIWQDHVSNAIHFIRKVKHVKSFTLHICECNVLKSLTTPCESLITIMELRVLKHLTLRVFSDPYNKPNRCHYSDAITSDDFMSPISILINKGETSGLHSLTVTILTKKKENIDNVVSMISTQFKSKSVVTNEFVTRELHHSLRTIILLYGLTITATFLNFSDV